MFILSHHIMTHSSLLPFYAAAAAASLLLLKETSFAIDCYMPFEPCGTPGEFDVFWFSAMHCSIFAARIFSAFSWSSYSCCNTLF